MTTPASEQNNTESTPPINPGDPPPQAPALGDHRSEGDQHSETGAVESPRQSDAPGLRVELEPLGFSHAAQLLIVAAVTLAMLKLVRVAHGDGNLAISILQASGYIPPIASILLAQFPWILIYGTVHLVEYRLARQEAGLGKAFTPFLWAAMITAFSVLLNFAPWYAVVLGPITVVSYAYANKYWQQAARRTGRQVPPQEYMRTRRRNIASAAALTLFPFVLLQVISDDPWAPDEMISTSTAQYHGIVVGQDDDSLIVLLQDGRYLKYVPKDQIESREMCKSRNATKTVATAIGRQKSNGGVNCPEWR
ncbi:hypothetical protein Daura_48740 [Dactylosporangium aurantiacum]|uniref:Uncharacterized protein n=1 Tax=Dactylosporangium aurantiacum TaxID=35754 RepID=A0A9Q9MJ26_9ACTN|nr:hypothetical protein [Dactylosporangium aurantiacum]MDG6109650.1 hypothetical protein [Dactylosporangium aurantiacum]UWZ54266.1 hypothetical protein Daura_48740 [Dactylosporangium aurantiacum]